VRPWELLPFRLPPMPPAPPRYANPELHRLALALVAARDAGRAEEAEQLAWQRFVLLRAEAVKDFRPTRLLGGLVLDWETRLAWIGEQCVFSPGTRRRPALLFRVAAAGGDAVSYETLLQEIWGRKHARLTFRERFAVHGALHEIRRDIEAAGGTGGCVETVPLHGLRAVVEAA
jgi:DNA-binding response OmpR family regulator